MSLNQTLFPELLSQLDADPFWADYLSDFVLKRPPAVAVHLAVFIEPYLQYVFEGKKSLESRFSIHRQPPFGVVKEGDVLLLKESGGPIVGICQVGTVWFYELNPGSFAELRTEFALALCVQNPSFWEDRESASYATLLRLQNVRLIQPIVFEKHDRRGWVVLRSRSRQLLLWEE